MINIAIVFTQGKPMAIFIIRSNAKFKEEKAIGNRLFNSPIFAIRRLLNNTETPEVYDTSNLFPLP